MKTRCYVFDERPVPAWRVALIVVTVGLCLFAAAVLYDLHTVRYLARLQSLEHRVEVLETEAKPMNINHDSTVNYFFRGERVEGE